MSKVISLIEILEKHVTKEVRGDEDAPHVSDLAFCLRKTWSRRNGEPQSTPDLPQLAKMSMGLMVEDYALTQLQKAGLTIWRDAKIALSSDMKGRVLKEERCRNDEVIGHLDGLKEDGEGGPFVIEVKSTSFFKGKPPEKPAPWYIIQAASYAASLNVLEFVILIVCRESGRAVEFWFKYQPNLAVYMCEQTNQFISLAEIKAMIQRVLATTGKGTPAPAPEPVYSWECKYCDAVLCPKNK